MTLNRYFFISSRGQTENHPMVSQDSSRRVELAQSCFVSQNASSAAVFSPPLLRGEPGSCSHSLESLNTIKKGELSQRIQLSCWLDRPERIPACWGCCITLPADWLLSTQEGRNLGRASKRQAVFFKERSFTLSASNYTTARPSLWCVYVHGTPPLTPFLLISVQRLPLCLHHHLFILVCLLSLPQVTTSAACFHWNIFCERRAAGRQGCWRAALMSAWGWVQGGGEGERVRESINMCQETQTSAAEKLSQSEKFFHFFKSKKIQFFL